MDGAKMDSSLNSFCTEESGQKDFGEKLPSLYDMKLTGDILQQLVIHDVDVDSAIEFFGSQVEALMKTKPNFGPHRNTPGQSHLLPTWVTRGYYPGTKCFFKMSMMHNQDGKPNFPWMFKPYYVKVDIARLKAKHHDFM